MDKLTFFESHLQKYSSYLKELVSNIDVHTPSFKQAVIFLASNNRIFTMHRLGDIPDRMIEPIQFFERVFQNNLLVNKFDEYTQIAVPFSESIGEKQLFLGMIFDSTSHSEKELRAFLEGLTIGLIAFIEEGEGIHFKDLLIKANFEMEFSELAKAFASCYQKLCPRKNNLLIFEKHDDCLISLKGDSQQRIDRTDLVLIFENNMKEQLRVVDGESLFGEIATHCMGCPIFVEDELVAAILFLFEDEDEILKAKEKYNHWFNELLPLFKKGYILEQENKKANRRNILMQVTKKFHSTMNIEEILGEIIDALHTAYPSYLVHLLLSQEWKVKADIPTKPLTYGEETGNKIVEHAYLTGDIQIDQTRERMTLYVPLRGKQGVYGVMEIKSHQTVVLPRTEIDFIQMLADTGGNALENAELYQQSRNLIHDLQLINETSHQLNLNLRLADTINFMVQQIIESFGAEHVGFIMFHPKGESTVLEGSTDLFLKEETQVKLDSLITKMKREKDPIYFGDLEIQEKQYLTGYKSMLVVPMIQSNELKGMVLAVHRLPYYFTFENFKLLQSLVHHSTLAFTNSMLHEELERLVITDHLTRLYSRNHLDERIQDSMYKDGQGAFLLLDIDNFKQINDTFGHQVGDDIIIQVANVMKKNIRTDDIAARWGGEELAIYLPRVELSIAITIAERIVQTVAIETSPRVTVSIGVSHWSTYKNPPSLDHLFKQADQALYRAKETGKNQVVVSDWNKEKGMEGV